MTREVDRLRLVRDVGDDPAAYSAKIEAERAPNGRPRRRPRRAVSPAAGLQPSLATARSVAGRTRRGLDRRAVPRGRAWRLFKIGAMAMERW